MKRLTLILLTLLVSGVAGLASLAVLRSSLQQRRHVQSEQARKGLLATVDVLRGDAGEALAAVQSLAPPAQISPWAARRLARRHPRIREIFAAGPGRALQPLFGGDPATGRFEAWIQAAAVRGKSIQLEPSAGEALFVWVGGTADGTGMAMVLDFGGVGEQLRQMGLDYAISWIAGDGGDRPWLRSQPDPLVDPVEATVNLAGGGWRIALAPAAGWASPLDPRGGLFVALLLPLLSGAVAFEVGRRSISLREQVDHWTARLRETQGQLGSEIRKREEAEAQLRHHAQHDPLTGLPNRASLTIRLGQLVRQPAAEQAFLMCIDIDRFKAVNDALGGPAGDAAIAQIAHRIEGCLSPSERLFRVGSDEFAVLAEAGADEAAALASGERIQQALKQPFVVKGEPFHVTPTIGIALGRDAPRQSESLLDSACAAVQSAKSEGASEIRFFETRMLERARARFETEIDLRRAIEGGELRPHLQPILDLASGRLVGFEALVRWEHPNQGPIAPGRFLPLAEEVGLMAAISHTVFEQICRLIQSWRLPQTTDCYISFNLCSADLRNPDCWKLYRALMQRHRVSPRRIAMELTETIIMDDPAKAAELLSQFREDGVRLLLDDFGTGHSSLSYLHRFSFDVLKIDRSFVSGIDRRASHQNLTRSIARLAADMGMTTVAEGIETDEELRQVRRIGCTYGQGYLFSKPLPAPLAKRFLNAAPAAEANRFLTKADSAKPRRRRVG